jgi:hypothetical protein
MNWKHVCNYLPLTVDRIRITWSKLSAADIATIIGDRETLATMLRTHYHVSEKKEEVMIVSFSERLETETAGLRGTQ